MNSYDIGTHWFSGTWLIGKFEAFWIVTCSNAVKILSDSLLALITYCFNKQVFIIYNITVDALTRHTCRTPDFPANIYSILTSYLVDTLECKKETFKIPIKTSLSWSLLQLTLRFIWARFIRHLPVLKFRPKLWSLSWFLVFLSRSTLTQSQSVGPWV